MELIFGIGGLVALGIIGFLTLWVVSLRRVVPTNMVHIVQSAKTTTSYGSGKTNGNVYYQWPSFLPAIGVTVIELPVSNFDLDLDGYMAYDIDRVPFSVDVTAFFRIEDTNLAAQRVESYKELFEQLRAIVQGAVRTILASHKIDNIMLERSTFGEAFTNEVSEELKGWGVVPVKNMELMDIRDSADSKVIQNIMAKKKSFIEMESRKEVADNRKKAEIAEIEAAQETDIRKQEAIQKVGQRTAEKDKEVGIANEKAVQDINEQKKITAEKNMAVLQVEHVKSAEINKEVQIVKAEEEKQAMIIKADGQLQETLKEAEGIKAEGAARADAEKLMQLAPVEAQIVLAKEIGENEGYQSYLVNIENIAAQKAIGIEQAKALTKADVKVISNAGDVSSGMNSVMDLFTSKGGTNLGGMVEAFAQTEQGQAILKKFGVDNIKDFGKNFKPFNDGTQGDAQ